MMKPNGTGPRDWIENGRGCLPYVIRTLDVLDDLHAIICTDRDASDQEELYALFATAVQRALQLLSENQRFGDDELGLHLMAGLERIGDYQGTVERVPLPAIRKGDEQEKGDN